MDAAPPLVGVATGLQPTPRVWETTPLVAPNHDRTVTLPVAPVWPRSAQGATAALLLLALGLLSWHFCSMQRWGTRPTTLEPGAAGFDPLDLNRADHVQLLQLPGVGEGLARRIESYRREHHGFRAIEDLRHVRGIGPAALERLTPLVCVEPYVPEEERNPSAPATGQPAPNDGKETNALPGKKGKTPPKDRIDVNRATATELQRLPGIGPKLSAQILEARKRRPFQSVDELRRVPRIGPKTLKRLRPFVTVGAGDKQVVHED